MRLARRWGLAYKLIVTVRFGAIPCVTNTDELCGKVPDRSPLPSEATHMDVLVSTVKSRVSMLHASDLEKVHRVLLTSFYDSLATLLTV